MNLFSDFEKFETIKDEWEPPTEQPYGDQGNRKSFLLNESAHDQYAVVFDGGEKVSTQFPINYKLIDDQLCCFQDYRTVFQ